MRMAVREGCAELRGIAMEISAERVNSPVIKVGEFAPCIHCKAQAGSCPRGLCRTCYNNQSIRVLYPKIGKHAKLGVAHHSPITESVMAGTCRSNNRSTYKEVIMAYGEPTDILPGPEKVKVLAERASRGLPLWHPLDATGLCDLPSFLHQYLGICHKE